MFGFLENLFAGIISFFIEHFLVIVKDGLILNSLHNIFYFENFLGINNQVLNNIYLFFAVVSISLLSLKLLNKYISIYILETSGDATSSPFDYLKGYIKGIIVILSFTVIYKWFGDISLDIIENMIAYLGDLTPDIYISGSLLSLIFTLIYVIFAIILYIHILMSGVRLLVLRLGIPFATTGLIDSDNGTFDIVIKKFFQTSLTILVQLGLLQLSMFPIMNMTGVTTVIGAIAVLGYSISVSNDLRDILIGSASQNGLVGKSISSIRSVFRR